MDSKEIIKRLRQDGWLEAHRAGSHLKFKHPTKKGAVTVIHPHKDYAIGTLRNIYKQAGWEWR